MARKCASAAILETLRDPRVMTMPAGAQLVWIRAVTAMQNAGISVLQFGSDIMSASGIAMFIQCEITEIETHLETIIGRGLLTRNAEGAVGCPMLAAQITRSEINRANGKLGGRPRKNAEPPGQTNMILPINGGKMKTEITKTETEQQSAGAENPTYLLKESSNEVSVVADDAYHETGRMALEAMGIDQARSMATYKPVMGWLAAGADRELILDVIKRKMRPGITTLVYFDAPIREAIAARPARKPLWQKEYEKAEANYQMMGGFGSGLTRPRPQDFKDRFAA